MWGEYIVIKSVYKCCAGISLVDVYRLLWVSKTQLYPLNPRSSPSWCNVLQKCIWNKLFAVKVHNLCDRYNAAGVTIMFSSCFLVQCLFIDLPAVNLWILPISLLNYTGMACSLLQEKDKVHHVDTPLAWKLFPKCHWNWDAVYAFMADCSWTEHKMAAAWRLQYPLILLEGQQKANYQHFTISTVWVHAEMNQTRAWSILLTSSRRIHKKISNLLQNHQEQIPSVQPIAVTVT